MAARKDATVSKEEFVEVYNSLPVRCQKYLRSSRNRAGG